MIKIIRLYLLILLFSMLFSQNDGHGKVFFNNGDIKVGFVNENYSDEYIKIEFLDGGWTLFAKKDIKSIDYNPEYANFKKNNKKSKSSDSNIVLKFGVEVKDQKEPLNITSVGENIVLENKGNL